LIKISIIIPIRNEEKYIIECITSIINFDYPQEYLEVIFVDGESEDNTLKIIEAYMKDYSHIKVLKNIKRIVPTAMNIGLNIAKGEYICRLDAHASYPSDYISKLLEWSLKLDADNVGAVCLTRVKSNSYIARAIQFVMSDKFGVGNSLFRIGVKKEMLVDTVPFGFYKKEIFDKIGYYNENLARAEDMELNKRLRQNGGKIFLIPNIQCIYYPRETLYAFAKNRFETGKWVILASFLTKKLNILSLRHFIPFIFILMQMILLSLSFFSSAFISILIGILFLYSIILGFRSLFIQRSVRLSLNTLLVYFTLHTSYGLGSFWGILKVLYNKIRKDKSNGK